MKQIPALVLFILLAADAQAQVVINEIMYRPTPTTTYPENTGLEYIELHNPTGAAVDLGGWAITSGTSFAFPPGTMIPAGGYLVVAANPSAVQSAFGISGVLGPWAAGSTLANSGEKIALSKPGGNGWWVRGSGCRSLCERRRLGSARAGDDLRRLGLVHDGQSERQIVGTAQPGARCPRRL